MAGAEAQLPISVVLGSYQRRSFIKPAIKSIRRELRDIRHEIIVVDGGSDDGSLNWLSRQKDVLLIVQHNHGDWMGSKIERRSWGHFMNLGFRTARGKFVCMLSDDCLVVPGAIRNGLEIFESALKASEKVGAVAFYWRNWSRQEDYMVGLAMGHLYVNHGLYLSEALRDVGYIDETNYTFYRADKDLCLRMLERGWNCIDSPNSFVEHYPDANKRIRADNFAISQGGRDYYAVRWAHVTPKARFAGRGDWLYLAHRDPDETYKAFPLRYLLAGLLTRETIRRAVLRIDAVLPGTFSVCKGAWHFVSRW